MGMVEVGEECPGDGEASSASNGHRQEETPALREGPSKWPGAKEPHTGPKACYEKAMSETVRNPLAPEVLVALATCTLIWEVGVPKQREQSSSVIGTNPMPHRHQWHCQPAIPLVCPFLQDIQPSCWVPTELSVNQQVHCAGVVSLVLQHQLLPRQRKLISPAMSNVLLPVIRREGGTVENVVQNVDVLDHQRCHGHAKSCCSQVPIHVLGQHEAVGQDAGTLSTKECGVHVPHVQHLLRRDPSEEKLQLTRHRIRLVGRWEFPFALLALSIRLRTGLQYRARLSCGGLGSFLIRRHRFQLSNLRIFGHFGTKHLFVLIHPIDHGQLGTLCQERLIHGRHSWEFGNASGTGESTTRHRRKMAFLSLGYVFINMCKAAAMIPWLYAPSYFMLVHIQPLTNWCSVEKNNISTLQTSQHKLPSLSRKIPMFQLLFPNNHCPAVIWRPPWARLLPKPEIFGRSFGGNHQLCWFFLSPQHTRPLADCSCQLPEQGYLSPSEVPLVVDPVGVKPLIRIRKRCTSSSMGLCKKQVETRTDRIWSWTHTSKIWNETTYLYIQLHTSTYCNISSNLHWFLVISLFLKEFRSGDSSHWRRKHWLD